MIPPAAAVGLAAGDNSALVNAPDFLLRPSTAPAWREANFLQSLGPAFGTDLPPLPVADPQWVARSERLADQLPGGDWRELSMGTSLDYAVAVEEGATLVRVGTAIVGERSKRRHTPEE